MPKWFLDKHHPMMLNHIENNKNWVKWEVFGQYHSKNAKQWYLQTGNYNNCIHHNYSMKKSNPYYTTSE
jgi:hypothetical protein